ncbi:YjcZ family sporulation protein [Paenibacillus sp. D51F]
MSYGVGGAVGGVGAGCGYGGGWGYSSMGAILVLFILLVIISRAFLC